VTQRVNLEQLAITKFEAVARRNKFSVFKGQHAINRIVLGRNTYFQFGDLRVETATHHVIVEAESAGRVTNLAKYWYCLTNANLFKQVLKPVILIHIFRQVSENDYASHLALWDFLWHEMEKNVSDHIRAFRYTYRDLSDLKPAIRAFESSLTSHYEMVKHE